MEEKRRARKPRPVARGRRALTIRAAHAKKDIEKVVDILENGVPPVDGLKLRPI